MRGLEDLVDSARRLQPRASASPSSDRLYPKELELKSGNERTRNTARSRRSVLSALAYHTVCQSGVPLRNRQSTFPAHQITSAVIM
jgi:hypothetical protein